MRTLTSSAGLGLVALLLLIGSSTAHPLAAQGAETRPIFLALPNAFPDLEARLVLLREPGREIVVLDPAAATADELGTGLRLLARFRRERGEPTNGEMIPIVGFAPGPNLTPEERARLEALIAELRERPVANVGNLGRGRWMRYDDR